MFAATSDALLCHTVASVISFYQRRLSPLKGFSCAPRVLHGGDSCSQFVKDLILQLGPGAAVVPTRMRLAACREANEMLRTGAFWPNTRRDRRRGGSRWRQWFRRGRNDVDDASDAFDDSTDGDGCGPDSVDCDFCDCAP